MTLEVPMVFVAMDRLPSEATHSTSASRLAILAAIVVVIVLATNALAVRLSPVHERTYDGHVTHTKWRIASTANPKDAVVVIGDSSGNFGVATDVLEEELGRPAFNLCTYGRFQSTGATWFLDRMIETSGEVPAVVLVVLGSRSFTLRPDGFQFAQIPTAIGSWWGRAPHVGLGALSTLQFTASRVLPLFSQHQSFEVGFLASRWKIDSSLLPIDPDGTSHLSRANPNGLTPFAEKVLHGIRERGGEVVSPRERMALRGLVNDAEERGYKVVFVDGPLWTWLEAAPEHREFMERVHAFLDEITAESSHATRLDGPIQTFESTELENPFHLVSPAAKRYTRVLSQRLEEAHLVP